MTRDGSGWSSFAKASLLVAGIIILIITICVAAGITWWKHYGKEVVDYSKTVFEQGRQEGRNSSETDCMKSAADRFRIDNSIDKMVGNSIRMRACLSTAQPSELFCEGVPSKRDISETVKWRIGKCPEMGLKEKDCGGVLSVMQEYCYSKERLGKLTSVR